jgi:hypothetical protein
MGVEERKNPSGLTGFERRRADRWDIELTMRSARSNPERNGDAILGRERPRLGEKRILEFLSELF